MDQVKDGDPAIAPKNAVVARVKVAPAISLLAVAVGAAALGAVAIGAVAIGRLAIGRLAVGRARFRSLEVDELTVRKLRILNEVRPKR